jgi:hypothetical protein
MSNAQMSNSFAPSDNLLDQSIAETTEIIELADEQLEEVAGGIISLLAALPILAGSAGVAELAAKKSGAPIPPGKTFKTVLEKGFAILNPFDGKIFG